MENQTPVEQPVVEALNEAPTAGTETPVTEPGKPKEESKSVNPEEVISLLEESDKALSAVEKKIVSLKGKLKGVEIGGTNEEMEDLRNQIQTLEEKVSSLSGEKDKDIEEVQVLRKRNSEIIAALRSTVVSNNSKGSNQAVLTPDVDPKKGYSSADLVLLQRVADGKGMSLDDYLKTHKPL